MLWLFWQRVKQVGCTADVQLVLYPRSVNGCKSVLGKGQSPCLAQGKAVTGFTCTNSRLYSGFLPQPGQHLPLCLVFLSIWELILSWSSKTVLVTADCGCCSSKDHIRVTRAVAQTELSVNCTVKLMAAEGITTSRSPFSYPLPQNFIPSAVTVKNREV